MYELIKLTQQTLNDEVVNTVNARELHEFLESKQDFSTWIKKRVKDGGFLENKDFISLHKKMEREIGATSRIEYYITIEMAKHLGMMERNEKGYEIRDYFIECEKKLHKVVSAKQNFLLDIISADDDLSRALAVNAYEVGYVKPLEQFKEQALPKVSYYDNVLNSPGLVTITQIAKDYGMTAIDFNKLLESLNIQYKQSKQWLLYHHYAKEGYTQSSTYITEYGYSKLTTKWTQKGRLFIYEKLKGEGILPICERE